MTETGVQLHPEACQLSSSRARHSHTSLASPSPASQRGQPATSSPDAQLDAELSELFDNPAPQEAQSPPPPAPYAEPGPANHCDDAQLDAELSELFDKPAAKEVPPSPPRAAPQQKRSLLHALRANAQRLSLSAARNKSGVGDRQPVSSAVATQNAAPKPPPADDETKVGKEKGDGQPVADGRKPEEVAPASARELMERRLAAKRGAARKSHARSDSSLQIINASKSAPPPSGTSQQFSYHDRDTTNMSLKDAPYDSATLQALFEHNTRVDIAELAVRGDGLRDGSIRNAVVFGVVVEKHSKKRAKDGSMYAVWTLYNMPRFERRGCSPTSVLLLLFGAAFERWHNVVPGAVFALRKPVLLPPRQAEKQQVRGVCLKVSLEKQLLYLGVCGDYSVCEALRYDGGVCGKWYDANRLSMCTFHRTQKLKKLTSSRRMDVNNALRPGMKQPTTSDERKLSSVIVADCDGLRQRLSAPRDNKHRQEDKKRIRRLKDSRQRRTAASTRDKQQASQVTGVRRKQYTNAVHTLERLGFIVDEHGSLLAPRDEAQVSEFGPLLKRARVRPQAECGGGGNAAAAPALMELSDESDSDSGA